ncbi:uncharacterized protein SPPG_06273 [Spizellomyces punctatus DAOM BR117]|uniref:Velvet domain-containing protein n=1 Tax=Spizellomyces punctatus (strain DAOM BR117) TaxID=645134 RepID=A0A0L0HCZ7_SPIPD|nr:uncharacterized protein SPPG_06273 [Spizellomyces punctatus DAOM BR117]KNC98588.1 hypothetical protein SPPG_06273 [Spizellomyces punctatus DAOM BR117]|eukprot:XP_016606628.1 hypothetical protein SPPG_06273 [Spizellomyces punctatus DAOM BR117]
MENRVGLHQDDDWTYELIVRQQPIRARMCGFAKTLERRLIDPPPILELIQSRGGVPVGVDYENGTAFICHASLRAEDGETDRSFVVRSLNPPEDYRADAQKMTRRPSLDYPAYASNSHRPAYRSPPSTTATASPQETSTPDETVYKTLVGGVVVPCSFLHDLQGRPGMYFVFHDLNIRTRGIYRLHFAVMSLKGYLPMSRAMATVVSEPFEVFTPAFFPGTMESTELSRAFARQGVPIHLRQDYSAIRLQPFHKPKRAAAENNGAEE